MANNLIHLLIIVIIIGTFFFLIRALLVTTIVKINRANTALPNEISDKLLQIIRKIDEIAATEKNILSRIDSIEERVVVIEKALKDIPC